MMKRASGHYKASFECARELIAVGCPIDHADDLPRNVDSLRDALRVIQLDGHHDSRVLDSGDERVVYLVALRLATDLASAVISNWSFSSPWKHDINWSYDPRDVLPKSMRPAYEPLFGSRLFGKLNERRLLTRGRPVDGLLCGVADFESLPKCTANGTFVKAQLSLMDDRGQSFQTELRLAVDRSFARKPARAGSKNNSVVYATSGHVTHAEAR